MTQSLKRTLLLLFLGFVGTLSLTLMSPSASAEPTAGAASATHGHHQVQPLPSFTRMLKNMGNDPQAWEKHHRSYTQLLKAVQKRQVYGIGITDNSLLVTLKDGTRYAVNDDQFSQFAYFLLRNHPHPDFNIGHIAKDESTGSGSFGMFLSNIISAALVLLLGFFAYKMFAGPARFTAEKNLKHTFDDYLGGEHAKAAAKDLVAYLKNPADYAAMGVRPPRGFLLAGPPGSGKTLLAKCLAGEAGVNFIAATGSDFSGQFVHDGTRIAKKLFKTARKMTPCIIFIDEIDGLGKRTHSDGTNAVVEREFNRTINRFLAEIDGFSTSEGIIIIGATNHPDEVDPALRREGRLERVIHVPLPLQKEREALFRLYTQPLSLSDGIDLKRLSRLSSGMSPAAIAYVCNHAGVLAVRRGADKTSMQDLEEAIAINHMGDDQSAGAALDAETRERIAVHELGHALIALKTGVAHVESVTIVPRGPSLGATYAVDPSDIPLKTQSQIEQRIQMLLGGMVSERMMLGSTSTGAGADLSEASKLALAMVREWGMAGDRRFSMAGQHIDPNQTLEQDIQQADSILKAMEAECEKQLLLMRPVIEMAKTRILESEVLSGEDLQRLLVSS